MRIQDLFKKPKMLIEKLPKLPNLARLQQRRPKTFPDTKVKPSIIQTTRKTGVTVFDQAFNTYAPLKRNIGLFRALEESIPFLSEGIDKYALLIGDFEYTSPHQTLIDELNEFKETVKVNDLDGGMSALLSEAIISTRLTGMHFSEIVPTATLDNIYTLKSCKTEDFGFIRNEKTEFLEVATYNEQGQLVALPRQQFINCLSFKTKDGDPRGISMMQGLPFVGQIFTRFEKSWDNYTVRAGDPTWIVTLIGGEGQTAEEVTEHMGTIADSMTEVIQARREGMTGDIFGGVGYGGNIKVTTLGADAKMLEQEVPISVILEQLVAKTHFSPQMLGIGTKHGNYQVTKDQNDLLVSFIIKDRARTVGKLIRPITDMYMLLTNKAGLEYGIKWPKVNLMDEKIQAEARKNNAEGEKIEYETTMQAVVDGTISQEEAEARLAAMGFKTTDKGWYKKVQNAGDRDQLVKTLFSE